MSLTDFTAADLAQPVRVFAARIGADHLGGPFKLGRLAVVRALAPTDPVVVGMLYLLVDDQAERGAIVRMLGESPDYWLVDEFVQKAPCRRRILSRGQWRPRASIDVT